MGLSNVYQAYFILKKRIPSAYIQSRGVFTQLKIYTKYYMELDLFFRA